MHAELDQCYSKAQLEPIYECGAVFDTDIPLGMRGIKKWLTTIYRFKKYRDTGIPQYFVTSSILS